MPKDKKLKKRKGATLLIVSVIVFVLSLLTMSVFTLIYVYSSSTNTLIQDMQNTITEHDSSYSADSSTSIDSSTSDSTSKSEDGNTDSTSGGTQP